MKRNFNYRAFVLREENASRRGAGLMFTSSTAERSPFPEKRVECEEWRVELALDMRRFAPINERVSAFPYEGKADTPLK